MKALINEARNIGKHVMVAGIEAQNHASIHLHETLGFVTTGQMPQVGTKFGRWLDLTFMQLQLDERSDPDAIS
jgi:phosphinothricin acetyltransferase